MRRWVVMERFLRAGRHIMFAGADTRMLRPAAGLFAAMGKVAADAAFDAVVAKRGIITFTPDIFAFAPSPSPWPSQVGYLPEYQLGWL